MKPTIKECRHGTFMYYANDDYVGKSLDKYGEYSEIEWKLYEQFLRPGMLIIDGGANMGAFTVPFGKLVGKEGLVYAFEPQLQIYQLLVGNVILNELSTTTIPIYGALGDKSGEIEMVVVDYDRGGNFGGLSAGPNPIGLYIEDEKRPTGFHKVPLIAIDDMRLPGCSFIKLDVEGMETEAIIGSQRTIDEYKPAIYVENNNSEKSPGLIQTLWDMGYDLWWDVSPMENVNNFFQETNLIFEQYGNINMLGFHRTRDVKIQNGDKVDDKDAWKKRFPDRQG